MREIEGSSALIVGYGTEGRSILAHLRSNYPGLAVGVADRELGDPSSIPADVHMYSGSSYLDALGEYDTVVRSPGVRLEPRLAAEAGVKHLTSATNLFFEAAAGPVVGITGTKGKSTVTSLIGLILERVHPDVRVGGNIGVTALDLLPGATPGTVFVVELSSQQLSDLRYSPGTAVVLPIHAEHLDFHGSFAAYVESKANICRHQHVADTVVHCNRGPAADVASLSPGRRLPFGAREEGSSCYVLDDEIWATPGGTTPPVRIMPTAEVPLVGYGNRLNVLAAVLAGTVLGAEPDQIREAVTSYRPLPHRLELVGTRCGIRFYNDSLATTPQAVINALDGLGAEVQTLIVGGRDRGIDFEPLARYLSQFPLRNLIALPETGAKIWDAVAAHASSGAMPQRIDAGSMREAVDHAFRVTSPGGICLLSPASASFGEFRNYAERGEAFRRLVLDHVDHADHADHVDHMGGR